MTAGQPASWPFVEVVADASDAEAFGSALLDAGATGVEHRDRDDGRIAVRAWFAEPQDLDAMARVVSSTDGVEAERAREAAATISDGSTPDDDWLRLWKRGFEPVRIGSRLLVYPSWKRGAAEALRDRVHIEIDPGMAFGTGTHETTRLCLEWLDSNWRGGSLVDVGTGTGILAIAAVLLAPGSRVEAIDVDPIAVDVARENAKLNGTAGSISFAAIQPESATGEHDVVLANLTADVIQAVAPSLKRLAKPGGLVVVSGVLREQQDWLVRDLRACGLQLASDSADGEWVALVFDRQ